MPTAASSRDCEGRAVPAARACLTCSLFESYSAQLTLGQAVDEVARVGKRSDGRTTGLAVQHPLYEQGKAMYAQAQAFAKVKVRLQPPLLEAPARSSHPRRAHAGMGFPLAWALLAWAPTLAPTHHMPDHMLTLGARARLRG